VIERVRCVYATGRANQADNGISGALGSHRAANWNRPCSRSPRPPCATRPVEGRACSPGAAGPPSILSTWEAMGMASPHGHSEPKKVSKSL
jgi:hypothetical protein